MFRNVLLAVAVSLTVVPSHLRIITDRAELAGLCRTARPIFACTDFVGLRLDCECRLAGEEWAVETRAQVIPFVYLWDVQQLAHEQLHIDDVRHDLTAYLQRLSARRFLSQAACEEGARGATADLPRELNRILRMSNIRRH